jgi:hypothetical protein
MTSATEHDPAWKPTIIGDCRIHDRILFIPEHLPGGAEWRWDLPSHECVPGSRCDAWLLAVEHHIAAGSFPRPPVPAPAEGVRRYFTSRFDRADLATALDDTPHLTSEDATRVLRKSIDPVTFLPRPSTDDALTGRVFDPLLDVGDLDLYADAAPVTPMRDYFAMRAEAVLEVTMPKHVGRPGPDTIIKGWDE